MPCTVMFGAMVRVSPPLLANIRPKSPVPLNNTSAVPPASALKVWLPSKRRSEKLLVLLINILRPFLTMTPLPVARLSLTNKVEPLVTVKSVSSSTLSKVPEVLAPNTGVMPPLSEMVPPRSVPPTKVSTPLAAFKAKVSPLLFITPVRFTVPALRVNPLARFKPAVVNVPPRLSVPPKALI